MKWLAFLVLFLPAFANAASCTDGTDCYCDTVVDSGHANYDADMLLCEDFESPSLDDTGTSREGDGSPNYGPWHDETGGGGTCNRGFNSYWTQTYGSSDGTGIDINTPVSPTLGCTCSFSPCAGYSVWEYSDAFDTNSGVGGVAILTSGQFDEISGDVDPTNAEGGASGQFDGDRSVYWRIIVGEPNGIMGSHSWTNTTEIGVTMAMAFPLSLPGSGIQDGEWKFHEFGPLNDPSIFFGRSAAWDSNTPFDNFVFYDGLNQSGCNTRKSAATITRGEVTCESTGMKWHAEPTDGYYDRSDDWAYGTWGCLRSHYTGIGTSNTVIKQWFMGPGDSTETLVIDISGLDTTDTGMDRDGAGYAGMSWNTYSNAAQDGDVTGTSGRYEDNIHITNGTPATCEQIGFGDTASTPETNPSIYMLSLLAASITPILDMLKDSLTPEGRRAWAFTLLLAVAAFVFLTIGRRRAN